MSSERVVEKGSISMEQLPDRLGNDEHALVLDVRSRAEYAFGHVPGAFNAPIADLVRSPRAIADALPTHEVVYVHCTKGVRSKRAVKALRAAGLDDAVLVRDSGFPEWRSKGLEIERGPGRVLHGEDRRPLLRAAAVGIGAGVLATLASGIANGGLSLLVSDRQKRREQRARRGSPHEIGGPTLFARLTGHRPSWLGRLATKAGFSGMYGMMWGLVYTAVRRAVPRAATGPLLPVTAAAFFVACDGVIAPLLRLTPSIPGVPWQFNAKELVNHVVWNVAAEAIHRADERSFSAKAKS